MAFQQSDLDTIDAALAAGGVQRVRFADGREVTYHSPSEMIAVRSLIKREVLASASQVGAPRVTVGRMTR